jgi:hypothetical protein
MPYLPGTSTTPHPSIYPINPFPNLTTYLHTTLPPLTQLLTRKTESKYVCVTKAH